MTVPEGPMKRINEAFDRLANREEHVHAREPGGRLMAGSYGHVVDEQGRLLSPSAILDSLDTGGDVVEAVTEMYAMIWWLAQHQEIPPLPAAARVVIARSKGADGLRLSPGLAADYEEH